MTEAVIVAAARTPIGRARKGSLVDVDAFRLAEIAVGEVVARAGIDASDFDDVVLGESLQGGGDIARNVAVRLGLTAVPGLADNRHCASGLSAVQIASGSIRAGMDRVVIAGGTESLSTSPQTLKVLAPGTDPQMWMSPSHPETPDAPTFDMSITVGENTAREMGLTRRDVDEWAAYSQGQAIASIDSGAFEEEIVAVEYTDREGNDRVFAVDEHPRRGTTVETLAELKPIHPEIEGATVTAGNAAGLNDAAAALVITADDYAAAHGLRPLARGVVGVVRARARPHGSRSDAGHPEGTRPRRALAGRHRSLRDQRGVLFGARRRGAQARARPDHRERERQRMQPGAPDRRNRCAHGRDHDQRAAPSRQDTRRRVHVRGRRYGFRDGGRGHGVSSNVAIDLTGKRVLVVGGSAGIGRSTALAAAAAGAAITVVGRSEEKLAEVVATAGRGTGIAADVKDGDRCRELVGEAVDAMGGLDAPCSPPACRHLPHSTSSTRRRGTTSSPPTPSRRRSSPERRSST